MTIQSIEDVKKAFEDTAKVVTCLMEFCHVQKAISQHYEEALQHQVVKSGKGDVSTTDAMKSTNPNNTVSGNHILLTD